MSLLRNKTRASRIPALDQGRGGRDNQTHQNPRTAAPIRTVRAIMNLGACGGSREFAPLTDQEVRDLEDIVDDAFEGFDEAVRRGA